MRLLRFVGAILAGLLIALTILAALYALVDKSLVGAAISVASLAALLALNHAIHVNYAGSIKALASVVVGTLAGLVVIVGLGVRDEGFQYLMFLLIAPVLGVLVYRKYMFFERGKLVEETAIEDGEDTR